MTAGQPKRSCRSHVPTDQSREDVRALSAFGIDQVQISRYIGVSLPTLHKWYRDELDMGSTRASVDVGKFLLHAASGRAMADGATHADCLRAAMFWAKTRMRWRETDRSDDPEPETTERGLSKETVVEIRRGILGIR